MSGNDSYTKLLIHSNTISGSVVFTDSSSSSHTITASGNTHHTTSTYKFAESSIYFDAYEDYLNVENHPDLVFGTDDFTIDFWIKSSFSVPNSNIVLTTGNYINYGLELGQPNLFFWYTDTGGSSQVQHINVSGDINSWIHIAKTKENGVNRVFKDGILIDTAPQTTYNFTNSDLFQIGNPSAGPKISFYLDEFRVSKGIARWTSNFTPPASPYTGYKISGDCSHETRVIVINESDWTIASNGVYGPGAYEITTTSGLKTTVGRKSDGQALAYGNVTPQEVTSL